MPVENTVGDLWSIMEFLNAGLLGTQSEFKQSFFIPIQAEQDPEAAARLKRLTGPFILRRLKTDKAIIANLPDKLEMKVYCALTKGQASLYTAVVREAERALDRAEGIRRKGMILATLSKLKQVCNHPAQDEGGGGRPREAGALRRQAPRRRDARGDRGGLHGRRPVAPAEAKPGPAYRRLLPRLVKSVQTHRGRLRLAGRGVRPRPVPDFQASGDGAARVSQASRRTCRPDPLPAAPGSFWGKERPGEDFWRGEERLLHAMERIYREASVAGMDVFLCAELGDKV